MPNPIIRFIDRAYVRSLSRPQPRGFHIVSRAVLDNLARHFFRRTLRHVASHSRFYQEAFQRHGLSIENLTHPSQMGSFFTTGQDLQSVPSAHFLCERPHFAFETTGTTGKAPKRVYFSYEELREVAWAGAGGLWMIGIRPEDRLASAFDYSFWVSGPALSAITEVIGCFHIEAGKIDPCDFYDRVKDYRCNVIVSDPSWLIRLTEVASERGAWPIKFILAGGENMSEAARHYMESVWKAPVILSYSQTESLGMLASECLNKKGYHVNEPHFTCEIADPDSEGRGELVFTTLKRRVMPLIRYRTGDVTRFDDSPCDCPFPTRRIDKIHGRVDEMVVCGLGNISPWIFEQILTGLGPITSDWQIGVMRSGNRDVVEFRLELEREGLDTSRLESEIKERIIRDFAEIWRNHKIGMCDFQFRYFPPASLRTKRKIRRIVDERPIS